MFHPFRSEAGKAHPEREMTKLQSKGIKRATIVQTGRERSFGEDEIIVTKTDPTGRITYANQVFLRVSEYRTDEVLGQPHSIIRHPDMPRSIFKLLWDTLGQREEILAYVVNLASDGDHYWVLAHIIPSFEAAGNVVAYH